MIRFGSTASDVCRPKPQGLPDGNGWSKLNGRYTAKGEWLYWADGDVTPNTPEGVMFTGFHGGGWDDGVDYSQTVVASRTHEVPPAPSIRRSFADLVRRLFPWSIR